MYDPKLRAFNESEKPCKAEKKSETILRFLDNCQKEGIALDIVSDKINGLLFGEVERPPGPPTADSNEAGLIARIILSLQLLRSRLEETKKVLEGIYKEL